MGVFILAINDIVAGKELKTSLERHFASDDQYFMHHACAQDILDHYSRETLFRPSLDRKINCIVLDSLIIESADSQNLTNAEELAESLRKLNYTGTLAHYGTRDLNSLGAPHFNVSGVRDLMTHSDLIKRIENAFANPKAIYRQNSQGIHFHSLPASKF